MWVCGSGAFPGRIRWLPTKDLVGLIEGRDYVLDGDDGKELD